MHRLPIALQAILTGVTLAAVCLVIRSYSLDSSVVYMELVESGSNRYIVSTKVNVPDYEQQLCASVESIREGNGPLNILPDFETDKRIDLQIVRSRVLFWAWPL